MRTAVGWTDLKILFVTIPLNPNNRRMLLLVAPAPAAAPETSMAVTPALPSAIPTSTVLVAASKEVVKEPSNKVLPLNSVVAAAALI